MDGHEHRDIGDAATGGASVNLGGTSPAERFSLGFGDVMALAGDYFAAGDPVAGADGVDADADAHGQSTLFALARVPGRQATTPGTRDEIVCALYVMAVDESYADPRFSRGGAFEDFTFGCQGTPDDVERRVRDRYLQLAATNDDHFVAPGGVTHERGPGGRAPFGSAILAYRHHHQDALTHAYELGRAGGDSSRAMAREAAAQHYLTDAFTAGHMRTPVAQIRRFWRARYPSFWQDLQGRVAADTAATLRELAWALRLVPRRFLRDSTVAALRMRTRRYPELSMGDFLARLFHDWDNIHGLAIDTGGVVYGDGHVHQGVTRDLAIAAARAGVDDVDAAFSLGASGSRLDAGSLYRVVRAATGAPDGMFRAEAMIPQPAASNPTQNWRAPDVETLWKRPNVGRSGATVGAALTEMMAPDGQFIRQLDRLGQGLVEPYGLLAAPVLGDWLARKGRAAYHRGFVEPLGRQPKDVILSVIHAAPAAKAAGRPADSERHREWTHCQTRTADWRPRWP